MHPHSYPSPPRIIAPGGPVSAAIRVMREANELPPLLAEQFDREALEIHTLRQTIQRQLDADFDRIDRCLVILDTLGGDADFEENGDLEPCAGDSPEGVCMGRDFEEDEPDNEGEHTLGWNETVSQLGLGTGTEDGDATALERYGAGFIRSGLEDDEDTYDREGNTDDNGIADPEGTGEQGFSPYAYGYDRSQPFEGGCGL